ncbi:MAG: citrate synthase [Dehalococcoidia bacterium]|nr:citrate synthase [Dehalococcoidia bacterium]
MAETAEDKFQKGLEGVMAAETALCYIDGQAHPTGILRYNGYTIEELCENSTFEEVCYLLWHNELPTKAQLEQFKAQLVANRDLPPEIIKLLASFPKDANPMDVLRSATSCLALFDPDNKDNSAAANERKAFRITARMSTLTTTWHAMRQGLEPVRHNPKHSMAADFMYRLLRKEPDPVEVKAFDVGLILQAEHGFNASTFAGRVTVSTLSDIYSGIVSGIGALKGPLHGGANENVVKMLLKIGEPSKVDSSIKEMLANKERIPGLGHRVYKTMDPRAAVLIKYSKQLGERAHDTKFYEMSTQIQTLMKQLKGFDPNVDFYSASVFYYLKIPTDTFTPVFAISRDAGWLGNFMEQYRDNRLLRPLEKYIGYQERPYMALEKR